MVGAEDFSVELLELSRPGKRKISIADFYNGSRNFFNLENISLKVHKYLSKSIIFIGKNLNIVILGAGQVGSELSEILAEEHDVTLIDINEEKLQKISDHNDLRTICGNCCYPKTLESADIASADLAVAMTQMGRSKYGCLSND